MDDRLTPAAAPADAEVVPSWVVQLVGRLTLENELLRGQLRAATQPPDGPPEVP